VAALSLPAEQSPVVAATPTVAAGVAGDTAELSALRKKNDELDKAVKALQSENEGLKEQFRALTEKLAASPAPSVSERVAAHPVKFRVSGIADAGTLNLRAGPGSNFQLVTALGAREQGITLLDGRVKNGATTWQHVSVNGYQGWVNADYLSQESP